MAAGAGQSNSKKADTQAEIEALARNWGTLEQESSALEMKN